MYALASEVIKNLTDSSWGHVLAERVLKPLGLSNTTVIASEVLEGSLELPYMILDDLTPVRIGHMGLTDSTIMTSAGGIRSTVGDLLSWETHSCRCIGMRRYHQHHCLGRALHTGVRQVTAPAQFGKIGFNPGLVDAMPIIESSSEPEQIFYHSGAGASYNHCFVLIPGS